MTPFMNLIAIVEVPRFVISEVWISINPFCKLIAGCMLESKYVPDRTALFSECIITALRGSLKQSIVYASDNIGKA